MTEKPKNGLYNPTAHEIRESGYFILVTSNSIFELNWSMAGQSVGINTWYSKKLPFEKAAREIEGRETIEVEGNDDLDPELKALVAFLVHRNS